MSTLTHHAQPIAVMSPTWPTVHIPAYSASAERFVRVAGHAAPKMPAVVHDALVDFADNAHRSGALLLRQLPLPAQLIKQRTMVANSLQVLASLPWQDSGLLCKVVSGRTALLYAESVR